MMQRKSYNISADAYLKRARGELQKEDPASLFYAAFELRCFVEARHDEYLDAQKEYARSIPKPYKIGPRGKILDGIFNSSRIQYISWRARNELIFEAFHVPVQPKLRKDAEWLGNLLHAQMKWRGPEDAWWDATRQRLLSIYRSAWVCGQGRLHSPLFKKDDQLLGKIMLFGDVAEQDRLSKLVVKGDNGVLEVRYLVDQPSSWVCDL